MKQLAVIFVFVVLVWVAYSNFGPTVYSPTLDVRPSNGELSIDGSKVLGIISFSNPKVIDGDSLRLSNLNNESIDLRLAAIDAPELSQRFGPEAKQHLQTLLGNQNLIAWEVGTDRYGRMLAFVFVPQSDGNLFEINSQLISDGFAWHTTQYSSNPVLASLESDARQSRMGLWNDSVMPVPPWEYRQAQARTVEAR